MPFAGCDTAPALPPSRCSPWRSAAGLVIGPGCALIAAYLIRRFLFGISPGDPATFAGVLVVFTLVTLAAGFGPARRATRIGPVKAPRQD